MGQDPFQNLGFVGFVGFRKFRDFQSILRNRNTLHQQSLNTLQPVKQ